ncbi:RDD family protein [Nocardia yunnanensis]|uniref:RDD family protein n=1 Tax=Nocardia yunnanensis TaxID=2382165 RepID=UPI00319E5449
MFRGPGRDRPPTRIPERKTGIRVRAADSRSLPWRPAGRRPRVFRNPVRASGPRPSRRSPGSRHESTARPTAVELPSGRFHPARSGARLAARALDAIIVGIPVTLLAILISSSSDSGYASESSGTVAATLLVVASGVALSGLYEISFVAVGGRTPGKRALGLRVVNADTATPPCDGTGTGPAFTRWATLIIPGVLTGGLWTLLCALSCLRGGPGHQGWHDRTAFTYVIAER